MVRSSEVIRTTEGNVFDVGHLQRKPFTKYRLDSEAKASDTEVISIKINKEERALIDRLMRLTNYNQSKVIKISLIVCENVILNNFGSELFSKLTSSERTRTLYEKELEN